ncbi:MAG: transporter substrate-binding domain-containing protein [Blautia sp.]
MKKMRTGISMAILLALTGLCISGCGSASKGSGTLKVGVRDDIMNFGYLNETTGKYYGLEIDLAYQLAEELGYENVEFQTVTPDNRKQTLLDGDVDCLIACYSIADTRLENFDFSEPYYEDFSRMMVEKSSMIDSMDDLLGKKIGVLDGADTAPTFAIKMNELGLIPDMEEQTLLNSYTYVRMDSYGELNDALEQGIVDVACMDGSIAQSFMNEDRMFLEETLNQENYGVATQKGSELSKPVAEAIQKMLDDGTIGKLVDKWN